MEDSKPSSDNDDEEVAPASTFPKSFAGHKTAQQTDRRAIRLMKTVRVYHDLSTIIEYTEDEHSAVTTIHLTSPRKQRQ